MTLQNTRKQCFLHLTETPTLTKTLESCKEIYNPHTSILLIKENARIKRYTPDTDYADDQALQANTSAQAESRFHSLEQTAGSISINMNVNKTKYIQKGAFSTQKLVNQLIYLGSNISSIESEVYIRLAKAGTATYGLSII